MKIKNSIADIKNEGSDEMPKKGIKMAMKTKPCRAQEKDTITLNVLTAYKS